MKILVDKFLGVEHAEIPLPAAPSIVIGPNASGKTSTAVAIAGLLSNNANPLNIGSSKRGYRRDGEESGEVLLLSDTGTELVRWVLTENSVRRFTEAPPLSVHCLALTDFVTATPKMRESTFEDLFLPEPRELMKLITEDLTVKIKKHAVIEDVLDHLMETSWKATESVYAHKMKEAKREWQRITGEHWGSKKGQTWVPTGWSSEYMGMTILEAEELVTNARDGVRALQIQNAVTAADKERADKAKAERPGLQEAYDTALATYNEIDRDLGVLNEERNKRVNVGLSAKKKLENHVNSRPQRKHTVPCPSCGKPLIITAEQKLVESDDEEEFQSMMRAWEVGSENLTQRLRNLRVGHVQWLESIYDPVRTRHESAQVKKNNTKNDLDLCDQIIKTCDGTVSTEEEEAKLALAEQQKKDAENALELIKKERNAFTQHHTILDYQVIAKALGPRGIRGQAMLERIENLKSQLRQIAAVTGWKPVTLDRTYAASYGDRPGPLCADSEKWRINACIQAAIAMALQSERVIFDKADILGPRQISHLVLLCEFLASNGIFPLVCATRRQEGTPLLPGVPDHWDVTVLEAGKKVYL